MTALYWAMTLGGLAMAGTGAYLLGKMAARARVRKLSEELERSRAKVEDLQDLNKYHELRNELAVMSTENPRVDEALEDDPTEVSAEPPTPVAPAVPPPLPRALAARGPSVPGLLPATTDNGPFPPDTSGEIDLVDTGKMSVDRVDSNPRPILDDEEMEAFREDLDESEKTRKISLDSTHDVLNLSSQVELLTDDLAVLHRELARAKQRAQEADAQSSEWRKRVAEQENLVEKLRAELKRRDEKVRHLMAEVGVAVTGGQDVSSALEAMERLDVTQKTHSIDVEEVNAAADQLRFRRPPKPSLVSQVGPPPDYPVEVDTTDRWQRVDDPRTSGPHGDTEPRPRYRPAETVPAIPTAPPAPSSEGWDAILDGIDEEDEPDEPGTGPPASSRLRVKDTRLRPPKRKRP